jgi:membrane associated rhomboid family serine protease
MGIACAYVLQVGGRSPPVSLVQDLGFVPARFSGPDPPWFTLVTAMFLHGGIPHLLGNLLFLWIYGVRVEASLRTGRFLLYFLLAGLGGHLFHGLANPDSDIPVVGTSGAISGILAAYLLRHPRARIRTLVFLVFYVRVLRVPAIVLIGIWLLQQLAYGTNQVGAPASGGVAWLEHIGGFATGLVLYPVLRGRGAGRRS